MDIDAQVVRREPLAVERVDPAGLAKKMASGLRMELVLDEFGFAGEQFEPGFVHLDHQRIPAAADRAVAHCQLREIRFDLEANRTAVATADIFL